MKTRILSFKSGGNWRNSKIMGKSIVDGYSMRKENGSRWKKKRQTKFQILSFKEEFSKMADSIKISRGQGLFAKVKSCTD